MSKSPSPGSRGKLSRAHRQFESWRRRRRPGTPIPEPLWHVAVGVTREEGISRTARALGLDYYALKRRVDGRPGEPSGRFLELPVNGISLAPECVVEIEDGQGARLRIELRGRAAAEVEKLAELLWSVER
jgi:hypothetical protein